MQISWFLEKPKVKLVNDERERRYSGVGKLGRIEVSFNKMKVLKIKVETSSI